MSLSREEIIAAADRYEMPAYPRIDLVAKGGSGATVVDMDGTEYLDFYGGHAVCILGHSPEPVTDAIAKQAKEFLFYSNVVHAPSRAAAAERLCRLAPWDDAQTFFVNSGAEANETALKIARKATGRHNIAAFHGSFHGRTQGVLAVCGMERYRALLKGWPEAFGEFNGALDRFQTPKDDRVAIGDTLPEQLREEISAIREEFRKRASHLISEEYDGEEIDEEEIVGEGVDDFLEALGTAYLGTCAAVIVEPIQSMGGMRTMTEEFAHRLRKECDDAGALLIFDEVQTAPARTGHWFAGERWGVTPDIITTAKAVAAGFPAGVVLASGAVAKTVEAGDQGTTFGGGPVACAAIDATLAELERIDAPQRAQAIEARAREVLEPVTGALRGHGAMLGIPVPGPEVTKTLRDKHRVLVGGCPGDTSIVRIFPPVNITDEELERGLAALKEVLS